MEERSSLNGVFDVEFYKHYYFDLRELNDEQLYAHWKAIGKAENRIASPEQALAEVMRDAELPAAFDLFAYLSINSDVQSSIRWPYEGVLHYLKYGRSENRRYFDDTSTEAAPNPSDPEFEVATILDERALANDLIDNALLNNAFRISQEESAEKEEALASLRREDSTDDILRNLTEKPGKWATCLEELLRRSSLIAFLRNHRNFILLEGNFNLATYLARYQDVASAINRPIFGAFHYLEYGVAEGRSGLPERCDPKFIREFYGVEMEADLNSINALTMVRERHKLCPFDLVYSSEEELASCHNIRSKRFLQIFDHEYYRAIAMGIEGASC